MMQRYGLIEVVIAQQFLIGKQRTVQHHTHDGIGLLAHSLAVDEQRVVVFVQKMPLFRRDTGISPHLYLANLKLERAFYLLETGRSLTQVCMDAGFATPSHMADTSRKLYGMSMTEVKQIFLTGLGQNSR